MGAGHTHTLYVHGHTPVHRLAPQVKVAATLVFVVGVAITPREALWAFAIDAAVLAAVVALARVPLGFVLSRLVVVLPFVAFALLLPFVGGGEQVEVGWFDLSRDGLWALVNVLAKASLGATASIVLAATTEQARILAGLERLKVPAPFTTIATFMLRYLELLADEVGRVRTAMRARGYAPRSLREAGPVGSAAGALFVRSYERGERVHAAMVSRGFTGAMPELTSEEAPTARQWLAASVVPAVAVVTAVVALVGP